MPIAKLLNVIKLVDWIDCEAIILHNLRIQTRGRNLSKLQP